VSWEKTNIPGYEKDTSTGVIVNKNKGELDQFMTQREKFLREQEYRGKVDKLEQDVGTILDLLKELVNKK
jgi:hypothetical protein